jgi:hypothetical protein
MLIPSRFLVNNEWGTVNCGTLLHFNSIYNFMERKIFNRVFNLNGNHYNNLYQIEIKFTIDTAHLL